MSGPNGEGMGAPASLGVVEVMHGMVRGENVPFSAKQPNHIAAYVD